MLIDTTYMVGRLVIKDITSPGNVGEAEKKLVNNFIKDYEPICMYSLVGKELYDALILGLAETTPETRWTTLRDKLVDSVNKKSPIANFVFFKYEEETQSVKTGTGYKKTELAGMVEVTDNAKKNAVWNDFANQVNIFMYWFKDNYSTYPECENPTQYIKPMAISNPFGI